MIGILTLTCRYLAYHRARTAILVTCLALTFVLPVYLHVLIRTYESSLTERAEATPFVLGPRGNQFELVLRSLYFANPERGEAGLSMVDHQAAVACDRGQVIPMHLGYTAQSHPVVGTSLEYFEFRALEARKGTFPLILGDAVLGAKVAAQLGLTAGDSLLTDQTSLYNIAAEQPLKMTVVGVLEDQDSPDDHAVFVDVKTAWVIAGIGHGHNDLSDPANRAQLLGKDEEGNLMGSAAVAHYREITPGNLASFHFHGAPQTLPLSSLLIVPDSDRSGTLLKGHYALSKSTYLLEPIDVVDDLLAIVFQVKRFFNASFSLILVMTILFLILVIMLTLKLRSRERGMLWRMGCGRWTTVSMQACELLILATAGMFLATLGALVLVQFTEHLLRIGS